MLFVSLIAEGREKVMAKESKPLMFDFEYFEKLQASNKIVEAKEFLQAKYPVGSPVTPIVSELQKAGAKCERTFFQGKYAERCHYERSGHGLMALVSTIEWVVVVYTDESYEIINSIATNRGATGM